MQTWQMLDRIQGLVRTSPKLRTFACDINSSVSISTVDNSTLPHFTQKAVSSPHSVCMETSHFSARRSRFQMRILMPYYCRTFPIDSYALCMRVINATNVPPSDVRNWYTESGFYHKYQIPQPTYLPCHCPHLLNGLYLNL
ncbi:hypothetical protein G9A89_004988 [Geosiphon pyriformis]|nr:hypothetical protein G9A89_004988 [Geosiphon pyriformis]